MIILGIIITAGGVPGTDPIGFRFWHNPGPFQQENGIPGTKGRFLAFWTVLVQSAFSYLGTEIVALTAGEAENVSCFASTLMLPVLKFSIVYSRAATFRRLFAARSSVLLVTYPCQVLCEARSGTNDPNHLQLVFYVIGETLPRFLFFRNSS